ncbi:MAG: N-acetyltransferase family protein [Planctomycetaceae bacterium]|nr:N-acetyltransferase family protein [Planctomycetaceae bacterium]
MASVHFAAATEADAAALRDIYAPYVTGTTVTFEYETPSVEEFASRIRGVTAFYPYLKCLDGDEIIGYGYAHRHMQRHAYGWNAELSVYIRQGQTGKRLGMAFFHALIEASRLQGLHTLIGCVGLPNEASERLHKRFDFAQVGYLDKAGYKFGEWHDVVWYAKRVNDGEPSEPVAFADVPAAEVERIFAEAAAMTSQK